MLEKQKRILTHKSGMKMKLYTPMDLLLNNPIFLTMAQTLQFGSRKISELESNLTMNVVELDDIFTI